MSVLPESANGKTDVSDKFWNFPIGKKLELMYGGRPPVLASMAYLPICVILEDHRGAKRGDDCCCLLAQAVRRQCGAPGIVVDREKAYVGKEIDPGVWAIYYYMIPKATARIWQHFDDDTLGLWTGNVVFNPVPYHEWHPVKRARRELRRELLAEWAEEGIDITTLIVEQKQPRRKAPETLELRRDGRYSLERKWNHNFSDGSGTSSSSPASSSPVAAGDTPSA